MSKPMMFGVGILILLCSGRLYAADTVFVFYPTEVKAQVIQKQLVSMCPDFNFTVFGRSKDFRKELSKVTPVGVLTLGPVVDGLDGFNVIASGIHNDRTEDDYVLVSLEEPLPIESLAQVKVGVIDLLGRKPMDSYVEGLFGQKVKLKRVTKVEDLLPLLSFGSVKAVLVSGYMYELIKAKTNLELAVSPTDKTIGLARVAASDPGSAPKINQCLANLSGDLNTILGVEKWRLL